MLNQGSNNPFRIDIIAAVCGNGGLSYQDRLPWWKDNTNDLQFVKVLTTLCRSTRDSRQRRNALILGRKTLEQLPLLVFRDRDLHVLTRQTSVQSFDNVRFWNDPESLLHHLIADHVAGNTDRVFVFGGEEIYHLFMKKGWVDRVYLTRIQKTYECDRFFPMRLLSRDYFLDSSSSPVQYKMNLEIWEKKPHREKAYLHLLQKLLYPTPEMKTFSRNGGVHSLFGETLDFPLEDHEFPLLTTKKMFFRGIVEELLWFLRGDTDARKLQQKNIHIWDGNTQRETLDALGLTSYEEGEAGPIYGHQWRRFNDPYPVPPDTPYPTDTRDQVRECIRLLCEEPFSRRILLSAWNPCQLKQMALPPCHVLYQFHVDPHKKLWCQMYQRSADVFLGLPFNIASCALLVHIFAFLTDLEVGGLRICIGDAHLYHAHQESAMQQILRQPQPFPTLHILRTSKDTDFRLWDAQDFELVSYHSAGILRAPMIV